MGKPLPAPARDVDSEHEIEHELDRRRAERRTRLLAQDMPSGVYPSDMFSAKRKAR